MHDAQFLGWRFKCQTTISSESKRFICLFQIDVYFFCCIQHFPGYFSFYLFVFCQVMEATGNNWASLYFVAAYILVNMVVMKWVWSLIRCTLYI